MKTLKSINANKGIEMKYRKTLLQEIEKMHASFLFWISAEYKKSPPIKIATDSSVDNMTNMLNNLANQWQDRFADFAEFVAYKYIQQQFKHSLDAFHSNLLDAGLKITPSLSLQGLTGVGLQNELVKMGWAVKSEMTPAMLDVFNATVKANIDLIKSIPSEYLSKVQSAVYQSYTNGKDLQALVENIEAIYPVTHKRAMLIARDQTRKANAVVNRTKQLELGFTEAIWMHSHGGKHPRPDHLHANGKRYKISEGCLISGKYIQPGEEINCRCTSRPILPEVLSG